MSCAPLLGHWEQRKGMRTVRWRESSILELFDRGKPAYSALCRLRPKTRSNYPRHGRHRHARPSRPHPVWGEQEKRALLDRLVRLGLGRDRVRLYDAILRRRRRRILPMPEAHGLMISGGVGLSHGGRASTLWACPSSRARRTAAESLALARGGHLRGLRKFIVLVFRRLALLVWSAFAFFAPPRFARAEGEASSFEKEALLSSCTTYFSEENLAVRTTSVLRRSASRASCFPRANAFPSMRRWGSAPKITGLRRRPSSSAEEYVLGTGGGVCQVSSTLFHAALEGGLRIVESHPHSLPVSYLPPSLDAMVSKWSDLKLLNARSSPVRVEASCGQGRAHRAPLRRAGRAFVPRGEHRSCLFAPSPKERWGRRGS